MKPNPRTVKRYIVNRIAKCGSQSEDELRAEITCLYPTYPQAETLSSVETALLALIGEKALEAKANGKYALTETGLRLHESSNPKKKRQKESQKDHDRGKLKLSELADLFHKTHVDEYKFEKSGSMILDQVWRAKTPGEGISHAFEVQNKADAEKALVRLDTVTKYYPRCRLYLIVYHEKDIARSRKFLNLQKNTSIQIVKISQIEDLINRLKSLPYKDRRRPLVDLLSIFV